jgi:hypothetical protein
MKNFDSEVCPQCEGSGEVADDPFFDDVMVTCPTCGGRGELIGNGEDEDRSVKPIENTSDFYAVLILEEISCHLVLCNSAQEKMHICAIRAMVQRKFGYLLNLKDVSDIIRRHYPEFKFKKDDTGVYILADLAIVNKYTRTRRTINGPSPTILFAEEDLNAK